MTKTIQIHRRDLLKSGLAASAALSLGLPVSAAESAAAAAVEQIPQTARAVNFAVFLNKSR